VSAKTKSAGRELGEPPRTDAVHVDRRLGVSERREHLPARPTRHAARCAERNVGVDAASERQIEDPVAQVFGIRGLGDRFQVVDPKAHELRILVVDTSGKPTLPHSSEVASSMTSEGSATFTTYKGEPRWSVTTR
jgi:hypothetical protein